MYAIKIFATPCNYALLMGSRQSHLIAEGDSSCLAPDINRSPCQGSVPWEILLNYHELSWGDHMRTSPIPGG